MVGNRRLAAWGLGVLGLVLLATVACWWVIVGYPALEEERHREAMAIWPELVKDGFPGDPRNVLTTFVRCFRKGDESTAYEQVLSTAEREVGAHYLDGSQPVFYRWRWNRDRDGEGKSGTLEVHVENGIIIAVFFSVYCT